MKNSYRFGAALVAAFAAAAAQAQIQVTVNNHPIDFAGQTPIMSGDRVLVPLRGVLERMGAHVDWDPSTQTVAARRHGTDVKLHIGETDASVNGRPVTLDVPAQIVNGSTMVPLRFIGEALGEDVHWDASSQTVSIVSHDYNLPPQTPPPPPPPPPPDRQWSHGPDSAPARFIFRAGSVFQVVLNDRITSDASRPGQRFSASIAAGTPGLPNGSQVQGYVADVRPRDHDQPGMIDVRFDRIVTPDGRNFPIAGSVIGLDGKSVVRRDGRIVARPEAQNNRGVFAGYGAGAGLVVGLDKHHPLKDATIGGLIGLAIGSDQRAHPTNVKLNPGTQFGVRLDQNFMVPSRR